MSISVWTVAHQAPLSMGFSRQEYSSTVGCHALLQGIFLTEGWNPSARTPPALAGGFFTTELVMAASFIQTSKAENSAADGHDSLTSHHHESDIPYLRLIIVIKSKSQVLSTLKRKVCRRVGTPGGKN